MSPSPISRWCRTPCPSRGRQRETRERLPERRQLRQRASGWRWNHVVGGLGHADVIVGMHGLVVRPAWRRALLARLASTSLQFMLCDVPAPAGTDPRRTARVSPASTSSAAVMIASASLRSRRPVSRVSAPRTFLMRMTASTKAGRGADWRWEVLPRPFGLDAHSASAGTGSSPRDHVRYAFWPTAPPSIRPPSVSSQESPWNPVN